MKKLILTVVALMSMTMTFAENENAANTNTVEAYNMNVNMNKLSQALGLSDDQIEAVYEIHKTFSAEMMFAAQYGKEERSKKVDTAISRDLSYMNYILNKDQYRKYLTLLNVTLRNRGIK
ncbi:MAG: hypothetical protein IKS36_03085 [Bacteroidales bacterium]|nr:hypothetical protein [Bacteroidales bacterium]